MPDNSFSDAFFIIELISSSDDSFLTLIHKSTRDTFIVGTLIAKPSI